jgi:hypothetical protein
LSLRTGVGSADHFRRAILVNATVASQSELLATYRKLLEEPQTAEIYLVSIETYEQLSRQVDIHTAQYQHRVRESTGGFSDHLPITIK